MKIKQTMRYHLTECGKATGLYYLIIACLILLIFIVGAIVNASFVHVNTSFSGASSMFLFVLGLNAFKRPFRLYIQNGISRKTHFVGFLLSAVCLALTVTLIDSLYPLLFGNSLSYSSAFSNLYRVEGVTPLGILWSFLGNYALLCFGFFLTTLYYRMNKLLKVLVSAGVPLLIFVVLPMLEVFIPNFHLFTGLLELVAWASGTNLFGGPVYPWRTVGVFAGISAVSLGFAFLLMRRAPFRDA